MNWACLESAQMSLPQVSTLLAAGVQHCHTTLEVMLYTRMLLTAMLEQTDRFNSIAGKQSEKPSRNNITLGFSLCLQIYATLC